MNRLKTESLTGGESKMAGDDTLRMSDTDLIKQGEENRGIRCQRREPLINRELEDMEENKKNGENKVKVKKIKINTDKKKMRKRSRRKTSEASEENRIQRWNKNAEAWKKIINNDKGIIAAKVREQLKRRKKNNSTKTTKYNEYFGDEMIHNTMWPKQQKQGTIRVYGQNINGVSYFDNYSEWQIILESLHERQIDIACLTEVNLDVTKPAVRYNLQEKAKALDKSSHLIMAGSRTTTHNRIAKRGGLLTWTRGNWSGRIINSGRDTLGRWTYITMGGKNNKKITIYTIYRVCDQKHGSGNCTVYMQQENDLKTDNRKMCDPREALLGDLTIQLQKNQKEGHDILVIGDVNEDLEKGKRINEFLAENNMYNVVSQKHEGQLPATYDRGSKCIDMIAASNSISPHSIVRCGYLPFYEGIFTDHRGIYIDINIEDIFHTAAPDTNREIYKQFTTSQVIKCEKYMNGLVHHVKEAKIDTKVKQLKYEMEQYIVKQEGNIDDLIQRSKILFEKMTQVMKSSERKVGKKAYDKGYPSSATLRQAAEKYIDTKKALRHERIKSPRNENNILALEASKKIHKKQLKIAQKESIIHRENDLDRLAKKRAEEWNIKASQAIVVIKAAEESKKMHIKQRLFLKPKREGGIKKLMVPTPITNLEPNESHITNEKIQCTIFDSKEMFNILLRQNFRHLQKSQESIFTTGLLTEAMGETLEQRIVDDILLGLETPQDIINAYSEYEYTFPNFMNSLKRATTTEGKAIRDYVWSFGIEEYKEVFSKTKETTACGPSGLHMSHWKAALEDNMIMEIHAFFIWAAFQFGYSYERWEVSWHCMLLKKKHPFAQKLRIIQLFEGDFNAGLKLLLGRKLMWHLHNNKLIDEEIYGSRKGKTGTEALINLQLLADHSRT